MAELSSKDFNALADDIKIVPSNFQLAVIGNNPPTVDEVLAKLKVYWKVIKPVLKVAKLITPPKVDKGVNEFISVVDKLTGGATGDERSKLLEKFAIVWGLVRPILVTAKDITGPKIDAIIDEVVKIGDLLTKSELN
jgi:hypothetical protein